MSVKRDGNNVVLSTTPDKVLFAILSNREACKNYSNCISGTFQYKNQANAIIVNNGIVKNNLSAHGWLGYPDSVLLRYKDGKIAVKRLVSIPDSELSQVHWAISGMGLLDMYAPEEEGYCKFVKDGKSYDYSDVVRRTSHTAIGVKNGMVYGFYLTNMSGAEVDQYMRKCGMEMAVMLDGGHIAAVNTTSLKSNTNQKQHNIIQFVSADKVAEPIAEEENIVKSVNVYSAKDEGNKKVSANFKVREFACKDGADQVFIDPDLVEILQKIRTHFGKAVTINSAYRTDSHNKKVGGAKDSQHLRGTAADIVVSGVSPKKVAAYAETLLKGTGGIGIYDTFCHIDTRKTKARWNG